MFLTFELPYFCPAVLTCTQIYHLMSCNKGCIKDAAYPNTISNIFLEFCNFHKLCSTLNFKKKRYQSNFDGAIVLMLLHDNSNYVKSVFTSWGKMLPF